MAAMKAKLGLDQPVMIQYFNWLVQLLHGNMGASYRTGHAVWADISERIGPTLLLTMSSLVFSILIAIPLGRSSILQKGDIQIPVLQRSLGWLLR